MGEMKTFDGDVLPRSLPPDYQLEAGKDEETTIPGGQLDPVYEKKAKVLNRAVCP